MEKKKISVLKILGIAGMVIVTLLMSGALPLLLIGGLLFYDSIKPFDKQVGIESYDKEALLEEYGSDLDSGLFLFPDDTSDALTVTYESSLKTGLLDTDGSIFLIATYGNDDFNKEKERLAQINCTVFESNFEDSDYHVEEIRFDTESYNYPAYVASDGYCSVYEYALIDEAQNRIIYALLAYPDVANGASLVKYRDYLKKDKASYVFTDGSTLDNFTIYSFSFTDGIWVEYSPEDEGRVTTGKQR